METNYSSDSLVDLEIGANPPNCAQNSSKNPTNGEENGSSLMENSDKKKKRFKKPPKPPRPPKPLPLDPSDQKFLNELTEIAIQKKARIERMRALKKMKNSKPISSNGNWCALVITVIFCLVIFWHGLFSRNQAELINTFHGSPESSKGLISVQFYDNATDGSTSSSPINMEKESGQEINGKTTRATG